MQGALKKDPNIGVQTTRHWQSTTQTMANLPGNGPSIGLVDGATCPADGELQVQLTRPHRWDVGDTTYYQYTKCIKLISTWF